MNSFDFSPEELERLRREHAEKGVPPPSPAGASASPAAPTEMQKLRALGVGGVIKAILILVLLFAPVIAIGIFLVNAAKEHPKFVFGGLGLAAALTVAGGIRSEWDWLEYRLKRELKYKWLYLAIIVVAAIVGLAAPTLPRAFGKPVPGVGAAFTCGIAFACIGLIILVAGMSLIVGDLRTGVTVQVGPWVDRRVEVSGYSHVDRYQVTPCRRDAEPRAFYWQVAKGLVATLAGAAIFLVPPIAALVLWLRG